MAAVRLLPFIVISVTINLGSNIFLHFIRVYKVLFIIAGVFLIAGGGPLMVFLDSTWSTGAIYGSKLIVAVGAGLSLVTGYAVATLTLKPEDTGARLRAPWLMTLDGELREWAIHAATEQGRPPLSWFLLLMLIVALCMKWKKLFEKAVAVAT
ncbi:hypothetical protein BDW60DRAFT_206658 [Aspergillus nidulans var. acristatus]|jgi:hypothetical protein